RIRALCPTTTESMEIGAGVMAISEQPERLELGDLFAQRRLDAEIERHVRARTAGAHAGQLHVRRVSVDLDELDVAAVGLHERPDPMEDGFHTLSGDHAERWGNGCTNGYPAGKPHKWRVFVKGPRFGGDYSGPIAKIPRSHAGGLFETELVDPVADLLA